MTSTRRSSRRFSFLCVLALIATRVSAGDLDSTGSQADSAEELAPEPAERLTLELSLEDAVRLAIRNNFQIRISRVDDRIRQRELVLARAVFDPFFNMGVTYAKNRDPSVSVLEVGGVATPDVVLNPSERTSYSAGVSGQWILGTQYDVSLSQSQFDRPAASSAGITFFNPVTDTRITADVRQPLLRGAWYGVNTADIRIAHNNSKISREELELSTTNVLFEVEQSYWELVFAQQNLEAKQKALAVTEENLDNVSKKAAAGTLAAIDVTTAESQVALRKVELEEAELLVKTGRDNLLDAVNYSGERSLKDRWHSEGQRGSYDEVDVTCTSEIDTEAEDLDRDQALSLAFAKRPEYRQIALNLENQRIRTGVARNTLLPSLDVLARWTQLGLEQDYDTSFSELNSGRYYDWLVGVEFSIPLSNRANKSAYRNARAELRKLDLQRKDLENQIVLEVERVLREIASLRQRVADLNERVRLQRILLQAERRKLEVGKSIAYTVSTIENDLVDNVTQALRAQLDLQNARANLRRVTGTTVDHHNVKIESP